LLRDKGNEDELLKHLRNALDVYEKCAAVEHWYTANCSKDIAEVLYNQGKDEEALSFYERAAAGFEKLYGLENDDTIPCLISTGWLSEKIAGGLSVVDKNQEALFHYAKAGYIRLHGEEDGGNIRRLESVGDLLEKQAYQLYVLGKNEGALKYYERAAERYDELYGCEHENTTRCLDWVSDLQSKLMISSDISITTEKLDMEVDTQGRAKQEAATVSGSLAAK
jgi:tetratricopeptide (TPR) repeat protein